MEQNVLHPDEVLKALLSKQTRQDKIAKLNKLHELCAIEYSRHSQGARDLSLSNMSKVSELNGLFKARTIYNAASSDYATIIKTWEAYNGPKKIGPSKDKATGDDKYIFLKGITDPAIRSLCQIAFAERDKLKTELNLLKSKTILTIDMRPIGAHPSNLLGQNASDLLQFELTDSERSALSAAIDQSSLELKGWREGNAGEILDKRDRFIFNPGFTTAIAKILARK